MERERPNRVFDTHTFNERLFLKYVVRANCHCTQIDTSCKQFLETAPTHLAPIRELIWKFDLHFELSNKDYEWQRKKTIRLDNWICWKMALRNMLRLITAVLWNNWFAWHRETQERVWNSILHQTFLLVSLEWNDYYSKRKLLLENVRPAQPLLTLHWTLFMGLLIFFLRQRALCEWRNLKYSTKLRISGLCVLHTVSAVITFDAIYYIYVWCPCKCSLNLLWFSQLVAVWL